MVYRRLVPRLGHNKTIGAIAHRICQLIWMILYKGVRYEERVPGGVRTVQASPHCANDPDTPEGRLPSRTSRRSGMSSAIFDPVYDNYLHPVAGRKCPIAERIAEQEAGVLRRTEKAV